MLPLSDPFGCGPLPPPDECAASHWAWRRTVELLMTGADGSDVARTVLEEITLSPWRSVAGKELSATGGGIK